MTAPAAAPQVPQRLPLLDLLRFLAAMGVLLYHYGFRGAVQGKYLAQGFPELAVVVRFGYLAMDFLFVLSGFVILFSIEAGQGSLRRFVASRLARLYPAFLAAALATYAVVAPRPPPFGLPWRDALWNLSLVPGLFGARAIDGVYWTLALELNFYLLAALCLALPRRLSVDRALWLWAALMLLAWAWAGPGLARILSVVAIAPWGGFFLFGAVCYRLFRAGATPQRLLLLSLAGVLALHGLDVQVGMLSRAFALTLPLGVSLVAMTALLAGFAFVCVRRDGLARGGSGAVLLGAITYPLYLTHQKIGYLLLAWGMPRLGRWLALALTIGFALALAWAIHRFVERPLHSRLRRAIERLLAGLPWRRAAVAADAAAAPVAP